MYAVDSTLSVGYAGVYASMRADFDDLWYMVDSADCSGVTDGGRCVMACAPGYIQTGSLSLQCNDVTAAAASWSAPMGACVLPPPTIVNITLTTPEACPSLPVGLQGACAARGRAVGAPINSAGSPVANEAVSYAIVGGNSATVGGVLYPNVFYIDNCGGQIYVNSPAALSSVVSSTFNLLVAVAYADPSLPAPPAGPGAAVGSVTIVVTAVPQPPLLPANQTITLPENSPPGFLIPGVITALGSAANCLWSIVSDNGAGGRFVINATTGRLSVSPNNSLSLNFEAPPAVFNLEVQITVAGVPAAFITGRVTLVLTDVNDPPRYNGATLFVNDSSAVGGFMFPAFQVNASNPNGAFYDEDQK